jgi:DNA-binding response OmpR family regulator
MKTILIVDDNDDISWSIFNFLRWQSYNAIEAKDGLEGWLPKSN